MTGHQTLWALVFHLEHAQQIQTYRQTSANPERLYSGLKSWKKNIKWMGGGINTAVFSLLILNSEGALIF